MHRNFYWFKTSFLVYQLLFTLLPQETAYNERHFPRNVLHGSWEAMWWAFASMTTLG